MVIATSPLACQTDGNSTRSSILAAAHRIVEAAPFASLATIDLTGHPSVRVMDASAPDSGFVVWLATTPSSRKVGQLEADDRVALHWTDPAGPGYVTLVGRARLVDDAEEKRVHWKSSWDPFYPNGAADALLIEVVPIRLEVISIPDGLEGDPETWRADLVEFGAGNHDAADLQS